MKTNRMEVRSEEGRWALSTREIIFIFVFWTSLALLTVANRLLDARGTGFQLIAPTRPIVLAFVEAWIWAVLTPLIFWLSHRVSGERWGWIERVLVLVVVGILLAIFVDAATEVFRVQVLHIPHRRFPPGIARRMMAIRGGRIWFLNEMIVYLAVLAAGFAREYFDRYQRRQQESVRLEAHTAQLEAQLATARLETLRMQLNPHFLFNTLHAVSALVERDPAGVRRMIARLSELLRFTLESTGRHEVSLEEEISLLERYLDIMRIRFQGKLDVRIDLAPETGGALLPNLILQPIVENAIKHGVDRNGEGEIEIRALRRGERLVVSVRDHGDGSENDFDFREGVGLANTRARLEQMYDTDQTLTIRPAEGGGVIATIEVPYHTASDLQVPSFDVNVKENDGE
ncbi:MAG: histidine kinase [Thermoanaerobaculia bacterium]